MMYYGFGKSMMQWGTSYNFFELLLSVVWLVVGILLIIWLWRQLFNNKH